MWQIDSASNAIKSFLPRPVEHRLRRVVRTLRPRPLHISELAAYGASFGQVRNLRQAGFNIRGRDVLEVGTGWAPVMPLVLRLAGARHIYLTDAYELLNMEGLKAAVAFLRERIGDLALRLNMPATEIERKLTVSATEDFGVALKDLGMSYHVPFDYSNSDVKVDMIISKQVLEHVPPAKIKSLLDGERRILRTGGMISHEIDNSDHREHRDNRICRIDFLRYSDSVWSYLCLHPQDYTNRLRHSDYVKMIEQAGFVIVYECSFVEAKARDAIFNIPLASRFQDAKPDDLAAIHSSIVAKRPSSAVPADDLDGSPGRVVAA